MQNHERVRFGRMNCILLWNLVACCLILLCWTQSSVTWKKLLRRIQFIGEIIVCSIAQRDEFYQITTLWSEITLHKETLAKRTALVLWWCRMKWNWSRQIVSESILISRSYVLLYFRPKWAAGTVQENQNVLKSCFKSPTSGVLMKVIHVT
jgi:hypothetical protein